MKEVHIVTVDGRIIGVYESKSMADAEWQMLYDAAKVVDQINDHDIYMHSKEVIRRK